MDTDFPIYYYRWITTLLCQQSIDINNKWEYYIVYAIDLRAKLFEKKVTTKSDLHVHSYVELMQDQKIREVLSVYFTRYHL